jgi:hypothetical protein
MQHFRIQPRRLAPAAHVIHQPRSPAR